MFVALFNSDSGDSPTYNNFVDMKEFEALPNINSLIQYKNEYYKIEHYRPISFVVFNNKEIMYVFISLVVFNIEQNFEILDDFFKKYKVKERKYKIKNILND